MFFSPIKLLSQSFNRKSFEQTVMERKNEQLRILLSNKGGSFSVKEHSITAYKKILESGYKPIFPWSPLNDKFGFHFRNYVGNIFGIDKNAEFERIAELEIFPHSIIIREDGSSKIRCDFAKVKRIYSPNIKKNNLFNSYDLKIFTPHSDTLNDYPPIHSFWNRKFKYEEGKNVVPDSFDTDIKTCTHGIHCFLDRVKAENYDFS